MSLYIDSTNLYLFNSQDEDTHCYMRYQETSKGTLISFEEEGIWTWLKAKIFCRKQYNLNRIVPQINDLVQNCLLEFDDLDEEQAFFQGLSTKIDMKFTVAARQQLQNTYNALFSKALMWTHADESPSPAPALPGSQQPGKPRATAPHFHATPSPFDTSPQERLFLIKHMIGELRNHPQFQEALQGALEGAAPSKEQFQEACNARNKIQDELRKLSQENLEQAYKEAFPHKAVPTKEITVQEMEKIPDQDKIEQQVQGIKEKDALKEAYEKLYVGKKCPRQGVQKIQAAILQKVKIDEEAYKKVFNTPRPTADRKKAVKKRVTDRPALERALLQARLLPAEKVKKQYLLHSIQSIFTLLDKPNGVSKLAAHATPMIPYQSLLVAIQEAGTLIDGQSPYRSLLPLFASLVDKKPSALKFERLELLQNFVLIQAPAQTEPKKVSATPYAFALKGLGNAGNSCYLNATIQSLTHLPSFYRLIRQKAEATPKPTPAQFAAACTISRFIPPNNGKTQQKEIRDLFTALFPGRPYPQASEAECRQVNQAFTPKGIEIRSAEMAARMNREKLNALPQPVISAFLAHAFLELSEELKKGKGYLDSSFSKRMRLYAIEAGFPAQYETSQEDSSELFQFLANKMDFPQVHFKQGPRAINIEDLLGDDAPIEDSPFLRVMPPPKEATPILLYEKTAITRNKELIEDFLAKNEKATLKEILAFPIIATNEASQNALKTLLRQLPPSLSCKKCAFLLRRLPENFALADISKLIQQFPGPTPVSQRRPLQHDLHSQKPKGAQFVEKLEQLRGRLPADFQQASFKATSIEDLNKTVEKLPEEAPYVEEAPKPAPSLQDMLSTERPILLAQAPQILPIQIERFDDRRNKVLAPLSIPPKLTVSAEEGGKIVQHTYTLHTTSIHQGGSPTSGHYYNYTLDPENPEHYYKFDDVRVSEPKKQRAEVDISTQAVLAIYERD